MPTLANNRYTRLIPCGVPRYIRVYDNLSETLDRFTVVFTGRYRHLTGGEHWVLGMNAVPFHPQGIGIHSGFRHSIDTVNGWSVPIGRKNHLGRRITFEALPADCKAFVLDSYRNLWDLRADPMANLPDPVYQMLCQNCVYQFHPVMLTGYCLTGCSCDVCGKHGDLAITKRNPPDNN
jgi:hypothetical protein